MSLNSLDAHGVASLSSTVMASAAAPVQVLQQRQGVRAAARPAAGRHSRAAAAGAWAACAGSTPCGSFSSTSWPAGSVRRARSLYRAWRCAPGLAVGVKALWQCCWLGPGAGSGRLRLRWPSQSITGVRVQRATAWAMIPRRSCWSPAQQLPRAALQTRRQRARARPASMRAGSGAQQLDPAPGSYRGAGHRQVVGLAWRLSPVQAPAQHIHFQAIDVRGSCSPFE